MEKNKVLYRNPSGTERHSPVEVIAFEMGELYGRGNGFVGGTDYCQCYGIRLGNQDLFGRVACRI